VQPLCLGVSVVEAVSLPPQGFANHFWHDLFIPTNFYSEL
jgi:hypothetical protein